MKKKKKTEADLNSLQIKQTTVRAALLENRLEDGRIPVVFSSEAPCLELDRQGRPHYVIFDHSPENIDKSSMRGGNRLSFLESHQREPMVTLGSVADIVFPQTERIGRGFFEFSDSQPGKNAEADFMGDHRVGVSVGATKIFPPLEATLHPDDGLPVLRFAWRPDEISAVYKGADSNAAAFRSSSDNDDQYLEVKLQTKRRSTAMTKEEIEKRAAELKAKEDELKLKEESMRKTSDTDADGKPLSSHKVGEDHAAKETMRKAAIDDMMTMAITGLGCKFEDLHEEAQRMKKEGIHPSDFRAYVMRGVSERQALSAEQDALGLSDNDQKTFSLATALRAMHDDDWGPNSKTAGFEYEVSMEAAKKQPEGIKSAGASGRSLVIPVDIINSHSRRSGMTANDLAFIAAFVKSKSQAARAMSVDQANAGGAWTAPGLTPGRFIDFLHSATITDLINITQIPGLSGDLSFAKLDAIQTAYMRGEHEDATLSDLTTSLRTMSPRLMSAGTKISQLLKIQAGGLGIDMILEKKLALAMAIKRNQQFLYGTGKGREALGILVNSGVNVVAGGANGLAPTVDNWINCRTEVAAANAGSLPGQNPIFLMNSVTIGKNQRTAIESGQTERIMAVNTPAGAPKSCIGHTVIESNLLRSNLTKGSGTDLSEAVFLNPQEVYEGRWGSIRVLVDEKTNAATDETVTWIHEYIDYMLGHAQAVSVMNDLITT